MSSVLLNYTLRYRKTTISVFLQQHISLLPFHLTVDNCQPYHTQTHGTTCPILSIVFQSSIMSDSKNVMLSQAAQLTQAVWRWLVIPGGAKNLLNIRTPCTAE